MAVKDNNLRDMTLLEKDYSYWVSPVSAFVCDREIEDSVAPRMIRQPELRVRAFNEGWLSDDLLNQELFRITSLANCLKSEQLKLTWGRILRYFSDDQIRGSIWLCIAILNSVQLSINPFITRKEGEKWKARILELLQKLEDEVNRTPSNYISWRDNFSRHILSSKDEESERPRLYLRHHLPDYYLQLMSKTLEETEYDKKYFNVRVHGMHAQRGYFARSLTKAFTQRVGKKLRRCVAEITTVVFDHYTSEREIYRLTQDLGDLNRKRLVVHESKVSDYLRDFLSQSNSRL